jgi:predicted ATPase
MGTTAGCSPRTQDADHQPDPTTAAGEQEYAVPSLGLPHRNPPPSLEQMTQFEAVRLFIVRAQAVKPDFAITN